MLVATYMNLAICSHIFAHAFCGKSTEVANRNLLWLIFVAEHCLMHVNTVIWAHDPENWHQESFLFQKYAKLFECILACDKLR